MKRLLAIAVLLTASVLAFATQSDAHVIEGAPTPSCAGVSATFTEFPQGTNSIILRVVISENAVATNIQSFTGTTGTVNFLWSSVNIATSVGGSVVYSFTWSSDGGGSAGPFTYDATSCFVPPTTTTTLPAPSPPTTTTPTPPPAPSITTVPPPAISPVIATPPTSVPPSPKRKRGSSAKPVPIPKAPPAPITPVVPEVTG